MKKQNDRGVLGLEIKKGQVWRDPRSGPNGRDFRVMWVRDGVAYMTPVAHWQMRAVLFREQVDIKTTAARMSREGWKLINSHA